MVLVEATTAGIQGNHAQITNQLIQKLTANPGLIPVGNRKTYSNNVNLQKINSQNNNTFGDIEMKDFWNGFNTEEDYDVQGSMEHFFHVQRGESVLYICLSDDANGQQHRINFGFLLDAQKEFTLKYTPNKILKANAYGMEKAFSKPLSNMMHHCNTHRDASGKDTRTAQLRTEVESIKKVLGLNIDLIMKREDHLEDLMDTTDDLLVDSKVFAKRGKNLKRAMKKKASMYKLILVLFGLLTIYLMIVKLCGFDLSCQAEESSSYAAANDDAGEYYAAANDDAN